MDFLTISHGLIDSFFARKVEWVTRKFCSITGRSSFLLARICILAGGTGILGRIAYEAAIARTNWGRLYLGLSSLIWIWLILGNMKDIQVFEKWSWEPGETLTVPIEVINTLNRIFFWRVFFTCFSLTGTLFSFFPPIYLLHRIPSLLYCLGLYVMTTICHHKGKSVLARAKDKVVETVKRIRVPMPLPTPQPIPVRIKG